MSLHYKFQSNKISFLNILAEGINSILQSYYENKKMYSTTEMEKISNNFNWTPSSPTPQPPGTHPHTYNEPDRKQNLYPRQLSPFRRGGMKWSHMLFF